MIKMMLMTVVMKSIIMVTIMKSPMILMAMIIIVMIMMTIIMIMMILVVMMKTERNGWTESLPPKNNQNQPIGLDRLQFTLMRIVIQHNNDEGDDDNFENDKDEYCDDEDAAETNFPRVLNLHTLLSYHITLL